MAKEDSIELRAAVAAVLGNGTYTVRLDASRHVNAHMSTKMRRNNIALNVGDQVLVEVSPYDLTRGRIVYKY
ncbi:MAG: translation initiation factor IF-1 [Myxococcales bacterium]|nr:translation initiation factor IF-1 [Myxococcales bacterium]